MTIGQALSARVFRVRADSDTTSGSCCRFGRGSTAVETARPRVYGCLLGFETYALGGQVAAQFPGFLMPYEAAPASVPLQDAINGLGALIGDIYGLIQPQRPQELIGLAERAAHSQAVQPDNWDEWAARLAADTSRAND